MTPPPIALLLKTKAQPQFNRAVDRTVEAFFCVFQRSNLAQFQACFLASVVRSAEGRKSYLPDANCHCFFKNQTSAPESYSILADFLWRINCELGHVYRIRTIENCTCLQIPNDVIRVGMHNRLKHW
jgi:hypothetical protein